MIALFPFHLSWDSDLSCLKMAFSFFSPVRPQAAPLLENYRMLNALAWNQYMNPLYNKEGVALFTRPWDPFFLPYTHPRSLRGDSNKTVFQR